LLRGTCFTAKERAVSNPGFELEVRHERPPSGRVIALLAALVVVVVALATVAKENMPAVAVADPDACLSVEDGWARLACYDRALHRHPQEPARGASVPIR
jgi:hypothetical protein